MAKKKPNKRRQQAPPRSPATPESKLDETVRMDTDNGEDQLDQTIDRDAIEQTMADQLVEPSGDGQRPDTTEVIDASKGINATEAIDATEMIDQTVIDQTLPGDPAKVPVYRGGDSAADGSPIDKTTPHRLQDSTVRIPASPGEQTRIAETSLMTSGEISQTINPRELSEPDATAWNTVVGQSDGGTVADSAEIEGTYATRQLGRLRRVDVAQLKSDPDVSFDYRLVRKLGQGGMGDVFVARQGSLDRLLALKLIKPLSGQKRDQLEKTGKLHEVEEERRQQFLSEAIVTGDLDHPNIVPIHDVGLTSDNQLFYAMKRVVGTPWSDVIKEKSRDENLEILLKVADAIAFAHARGVVHRDIKPENIMLGDFGVVMVMDWGLALLTSGYEKGDSILTTSGLGGTPAFMAPEMATGPLESIGTASDIYLLGATLFSIITGKPPHYGKNVTECLMAVRNNKIREVNSDFDDELLGIALTAMASKPQDRYHNVEAFQAAIREYRSHAESISLATRAADDLASAKQNRSYADFSRATFRFEESLKSWQGNQQAQQGLAETRLLHATAAYENGDYDLGLSLLDDSDPQHLPIINQLRNGLAERQSRVARLALLRKVAAAMLVFIVVGGAFALYRINSEKRLAEQARDQAVVARERAETSEADAVVARDAAREAKKLAEEQQFLAEINAEEAREQEQLANQQRAKAEAAEQTALQARDDAKASQQLALYEEYVSKIGLAKARLQRNEVDGAREILTQLKLTDPKATETWEWRWLWRQANQSQSSIRSEAPMIDLSTAPSGTAAVVLASNGSIRHFNLNADGSIAGSTPVTVSFDAGAQPTAVAISNHHLAIGTSSGSILLVEGQSTQRLAGHTGPIADLQFTTDGLLVSGSRDKTVRVWNPTNGQDLTARQACWHISPVRQLAVASHASRITLAVAIADEASGQVQLWNLRRDSGSVTVEAAGSFRQHAQQVSAVAISPDGARIASGDAGGNVLIWNRADLRPTDHSAALEDAVAALDDRANPSSIPPPGVDHDRLIDQAISAEPHFVSTRSSQQESRAHTDKIRSIRFNERGTELLTASDDHTLKLWDADKSVLHNTFKGHGGWVVTAEFLNYIDDAIVSASNDGTLRSWQPSTYIGAFVGHQPHASAAASGSSRQTEAHNDEIWSASFSPDGTHVVTASDDHTARVMKINSETLEFAEVARLEAELLSEGSDYVAMSMQLDRPGNRLYIGSADSTVRVWDLQRGVQLGQAVGTGLNLSFAISADGRWMLTGSSSPEAKAILWRLGAAAPQIVHRLQGHEQAVTAFAISPDSNLLFTGDRDGRGIVWETESGQPVGKPFDHVLGYRINAAEFSPDGRELWVAADSEQLLRINVLDRQVASRLSHNGLVTQLSTSPDGRYAVTVSESNSFSGSASTATLWNLATKEKFVLAEAKYQGRERPQRVTSARFDADGQHVVVGRTATSQSAAAVQIWNMDRFSESTQLVSATAPAGQARSSRHAVLLPAALGTADVVLPIDGDSMITMNKNGAFRWDLKTRRLTKSYRAHAALTEASFSFDGRRVATASRSVKIWDAQTGIALGKIDGPHVGPVRTVQFAPRTSGATGFVLATGGDDGVARIWSWDDNRRELTQQHEYAIAEQPTAIRRVRFSPDSSRLLIVGDGGIARLWMPERGTSVKFDGLETDRYSCAAFSPDGNFLAIGSIDRVVRLWKIPATGQRPGEPTILSGHADAVLDVHWIGRTVDDFRVLTAAADDTARIWDPRLGGDAVDGRELLSLRRHRGDVTAIDATNDGALVMTAGTDGQVILWPADR